MSKRFNFSLQRPLEWYRQSLAAEKSRLQRCIAEVREVDRIMDSLERRRLQEQRGLEGGAVMLGNDLRGLAQYLGLIRDELAKLRVARVRKEAAMVEQRRRVTACHRRVRQLERLEEQRKSEWLLAASVEEDALASELFLASTIRDAAREQEAGRSGV